MSQELLLTSLTDYYNKKKSYKQTLKDIIDGKHTLSLRIIDWFVTHYSKTKNIYYWIDDNSDKNNIYETFPVTLNNCDTFKKVHLYLDYRAQLKSYTKFNFDSFRRHDRITFFLNEEKTDFIETTIGQLNFFRWAFNNKVIDYAMEHYNDIYENMTKHSYKKIIKDKTRLSLIPRQDIINTTCYLRFD
jgi:hypothetical protein